MSNIPTPRSPALTEPVADPLLEAAAPLVRPTCLPQAVPCGDGTIVYSPVANTPTTLPLIPGYEVLEVLGRGGMGVVYKARQANLKRIVALKMLLAGQHAGEKERARFDREADIVAKFQHRHIVQVYDKGARDGVPFLAMEYCERGSLAKHFGGRPQPPRDAARAAKELAEAVAHAHLQKIVHRDLKPDNVLVAQDGTFKIADFGLALLLDDQSRLTSRGALVGTPGYMAPEQAAGWYDQLGPAADIYGLGGILYTLLTGRPPFAGKSLDELLSQVLGAEPIRPRSLEPNVPRDLETICLKCLEKQPRHRYATAAQLGEDLGHFLEDKPITARPVGRLFRGWRWCRRNPVVAGLSAAAVALLVCVAVSASFVAFSFRAKAEAEAKARATLEEQQYDNFISVAERELTLNQDIVLASELLDKCPERLRGWEWDYLMRLRDGSRPPLGSSPPLGGRPAIKGTEGGHNAGVWMATFSPDGRRVATCSIDGTVKVWDAPSGRLLLTYSGHDWSVNPFGSIPHIPVLCLAFSPDGQRLASGSFSPRVGKLRDSPGVVKVWEVDTRRQIVEFHEQTGPVLSLAFSPDGRRIASATMNNDNSFVVWDAQTAAVVRVVRGHARHIYRLRYSPDGRFLASGCADGIVKIWDAADLTEIRTLSAHPAPVQDVAFSPDNAHFATASLDGTVRLWDTMTGAAVAEPLHGHTGSAMGVAFSPDGKRLASAGYDKTVRVWDAASGRLKITLRGHTDMVTSIAFSPNGRQLVSASLDSTARIWDATPRKESVGPGLFTATGHSDRVNSVAFSNDGRFLASGSWDNTVRLWNAQTGEALRTLKGHTGAVWCVAFSPDGKRVASASWDNTVKLWDTETGREQLTFTGHSAQAHCVVFSPDGKRVASGGMDAFVKIWDSASGKIITRCDTGLFPIASVAFSPDGKRLATGSTDRTATIWDAETGNALFTLKGHAGAIPSLSFSPDGKRLVTASWDYTLKVWDVNPNRSLLAFQTRELRTLKGHTDQVNGVAWSRDGSRIASAGEDKTVRIWDAATGEETSPYRLHRGVVWSVSFSPDGKRVAAGCWAGPGWVKTWDAGPTRREVPSVVGSRDALGR